MDVENYFLDKIEVLPMLPESVHKISAICHDPLSGIRDLVDIVQTDPMLSANLLKAANAPVYGMSRKITTVSQAVSLFGMYMVRGFALASAVKETIILDVSCYSIENYQFVEVATQQNALLMNWIGRHQPKMMDILAPLSFIDNVGQILVNNYIKEHHLEAEFSDVIIKYEFIEEAEIALIKKTSQQIVSKLFEHWLFEEALVETMSIIDYENSESSYIEYARILHVMRTLINNKSQLESKQIDKALFLADKYGFDTALLESEIERLLGVVAA
jgi:HD-like signal output (HDOD) protein